MVRISVHGIVTLKRTVFFPKRLARIDVSKKYVQQKCLFSKSGGKNFALFLIAFLLESMSRRNPSSRSASSPKVGENTLLFFSLF